MLQRRSRDRQVPIACHAYSCSNVRGVGATKVCRLVTLASLLVRACYHTWYVHLILTHQDDSGIYDGRCVYTMLR